METYHVAKQYGFEALTDKPKTGFYRFADVDDDFIITIHHWLKWFKFGFTRLWDNLSLEIRSKRMSRSEAIEIIKNTEEEYPKESIEKFCNWSNLTKKEFITIVSSFRNKTIWKLDNAKWKIDNFLISEWKWNNQL